MNRSPNFINIGTGRCATSWLFEVLRSHPDIGMATVKETEFFNTNFANGTDWYERHFLDGNQKAVGEISTNYYLDPEVAQRIHDYKPAMKIMINVRKPIDLLRSYYQFGLRRGVDMQDCQSVLDQPIGPIMGSGYEYRERKKCLTVCDQRTLLEAVCLEARLRPYFKRFPSENIYVLIYERLASQQEQVLAEIYEFLGVDSKFKPEAAAKVVNVAIAPKSKAIARIATRASFLLRRLGLYSLQHFLKENELVKQMLYSRESASNLRQDVFRSLPAALISQLENETEKMAALYPALAPWWTANTQVKSSSMPV